MDIQENSPPLQMNTADVELGDKLDDKETFGGVLTSDATKDALTTQQVTARQFQGEVVPTSPCTYEEFFKVTFSDGRTVYLHAPNKTASNEDAAAQEAVKFTEDPAAELEAFLLAFAQSE